MAKQKVIILGGSGLIGQYLLKHFKMGWEVKGTYNSNWKSSLIKLDMTDFEMVSGFIHRGQAQVIVNATGMAGGVDYCEMNKDKAKLHYFDSTAHIVDICKRLCIKYVSYSTDYIFDGEIGPYDEEAEPNPLSYYGKLKANSEKYILANLKDHLIIRTTWVYDWAPGSKTKNFVMSILDKLEAANTVEVAVDQIGNATLADNLAEATKELIDKDLMGIFNICGCERVSRYDWAVRVANVFGFNKEQIIPEKTENLNQIARRPLNAGFKLDKARTVLSTKLLSVKEGLEKMKRHREEYKTNNDKSISWKGLRES